MRQRRPTMNFIDLFQKMAQSKTNQTYLVVLQAVNELGGYSSTEQITERAKTFRSATDDNLRKLQKDGYVEWKMRQEKSRRWREYTITAAGRKLLTDLETVFLPKYIKQYLKDNNLTLTQLKQAQ